MPTPTPVLHRDGLIAAFFDYVHPREQWRVGVELERHLLRPDGTPLPYFGENGVRSIIETMAPNGWKPYFEGENPIALFRGGASVTLEPGSQYEFSGSPWVNIADVESEARAFVHELDEAIGDRPICPVALGYTPVAAIDDIAWVPKSRYAVMRDYLAETGHLAHHMMKGTCATQASYDFSSEADCAEKVRLGILISPLITAIFANSPLTGGEPNGWASFRGHIWTQTDPRRCGFPEAAEKFTFERWVDYLLDVPMMFTQGPQGFAPAHGRSFRSWMLEGNEGVWPDMADWDLHMTSVFPEVRVKKFIEIRGADCVSHELAVAFSALFKALLYDDQARSEATELAVGFASHGTSAARFEVACREGLAGQHGGRRLASWAEDLVNIAANGLDRLNDQERRWIAPLIQQVASGESPGTGNLRRWVASNDRSQQVQALRYTAP